MGVDILKIHHGDTENTEQFLCALDVSVVELQAFQFIYLPDTIRLAPIVKPGTGYLLYANFYEVPLTFLTRSYEL